MLSQKHVYRISGKILSLTLIPERIVREHFHVPNHIKQNLSISNQNNLIKVDPVSMIRDKLYKYIILFKQLKWLISNNLFKQSLEVYKSLEKKNYYCKYSNNSFFPVALLLLYIKLKLYILVYLAMNFRRWRRFKKRCEFAGVVYVGTLIFACV